MKVAFVHPDLGIGGAERLVVDMALALQNKGHDVTIYTSHHDPTHAFDETVNGTLKVKVRGNTVFPRNILGKFSIFCAIARQLHLTVSLIFDDEYDVYIPDQLPAAVPYLRMGKPNSRILFYCHHPDLKLASRETILKKLYRVPFDAFERWCTSKSDVIAVNSLYTRSIFFESFGKESMPDPSVLYPVVDPAAVGLSQKAKKEAIQNNAEIKQFVDKLSVLKKSDSKLLLSINRFERKKDIDLAISAFSLLLHAHPELRNHTLVIAGGYDTRVTENIEYLEELQKLAAKFRIPSATKFPSDPWKSVDFSVARVLFLPSMSSIEKAILLEESQLLLYTPTNEHFGIVPLEAMCVGTPVLATNTGGPLETVVEGETGWLRKPDMEDWYKVIKMVVKDMSPADLEKIGEKAKQRVNQEFTLRNMELLANNLLLKAKETPRKNEQKVTNNTIIVTGLVNLGLTGALLMLVLFIHICLWIYPYLIESLQW